VAFVRCRKCRGGTPTGERAALSARPHPEGCGRKATRLSASRRPVLFEHDSVFRKDRALLNAERDLEAAGLHRRRLMTGSGFASCAWYRQNSGAQASRERVRMSTSPRVRGEGEVAKRPEVRGPRRDSERSGSRRSAADLATRLKPSGEVPSPRPSPRVRGEGDHWASRERFRFIRHRVAQRSGGGGIGGLQPPFLEIKKRRRKASAMAKRGGGGMLRCRLAQRQSSVPRAPPTAPRRGYPPRYAGGMSASALIPYRWNLP
jgi:hypothetical protein